MPRLPQPGGDTGNWGQILNDYLSQAHNPNGSLKDGLITASNLTQDVQDKLAIIAGQQGATGPQGLQGASGSSGSVGASGAIGATGATGATGPGVPTGGIAGQILAKTSNANYDTGWITAPSGGGGGPITIADLPAGSVLFARYNTGTSTWPARPTARTDIMVHWVGGGEDDEPTAALNGVDIWDWNGS